MSAPDTLHRIRRKPPPSLDISDRYPPPDPADPFAPLWALRNRTSSGLSRQDIPESNIVNRARSASHSVIYTTTPLSLNTPLPSLTSEFGHYSQTTLTDSPLAFPNFSSPLASQPDLLYREQPFVDRPINIHRTDDLNDSNSSWTESNTASVPPLVHNPASSQPTRTPSSIRRFPMLLLFKKPNSFKLGSGNAATGNRSSKIEVKQARQKSIVLPPVVSTVTWIPSPVNSNSINSRSTSKFTTLLSADLNDDHDRHKKGNVMPSKVRENLKQDLPRTSQLASISKMFKKKRTSSSIPFSSTTASHNRSSSIASSYIHISMPTPVLSFPQHTEDAYTSPRKAPVPPLVTPSTIQRQLPSKCPEKFCGLGSNCIHSISSEWGLPSLLQLNHAACLPITGENGERITFGSLFESQRTIVIFIRHFWCPLCQDYMSSVNSFIRPEMVCNTCKSGDRHRSSHEETIRGSDHNAGTRVRFVVISNGAHGMIAKYRQIFGLSFMVYTDPSMAVYQALGMGRDGGTKHQTHRPSTSSVGSSSGTISEKNSDISKPGGYVKHSFMGGIAMVVMRAVKVGMPVWEKGGDIDQLGGEFVFGPGLTCTYAHRMQTTKGHAPIQEILKAADILAASNPNHTLSSAEGRRANPELPIAPDCITSSPGSNENGRKRRESMHTIREKETESSQSLARSARKTTRRRYSIGMMSLEDEERWMEYRHDSIERLRAKKDIRRGIIGADSSMLHSSRPEHHQPLEMMDSHIIGDHRRTRSAHASYFYF